jgi:hypothetical protein
MCTNALAQDLEVSFISTDYGRQLKANTVLEFSVTVNKIDTLAPRTSCQLYYFWNTDPAQKFGKKATIGRWGTFVKQSITVPNTVNDSAVFCVYLTSENDSNQTNDTLYFTFYVSDRFKTDLETSMNTSSANDFIAIGAEVLLPLKIKNIGSDTFTSGSQLRLRCYLGGKSIFENEAPVITYTGADLLPNDSTTIEYPIYIPADARAIRQQLCFELYWIEYLPAWNLYIIKEDYELNNEWCYTANVVEASIGKPLNEDLQISSNPNEILIKRKSESIDIESIEIFSLNGQMLLSATDRKSVYRLKTAEIKGIVILNITTNKGVLSQKLFL